MPRSAFVSGSGRNIGRAIALKLAQAGVSIVVNGRSDQAACDAVADDGPSVSACAKVVSDSLISRLRGELKVQLEPLIRVVPEDDDIIQNHSWRGYRLSPHLSYTAVAEEGRAAPAAAE